ncbi:C69 family dipeptidase [Pseudooceanicola sp. CBS1P-1]|uniref:Dipeptidase n=1 Tax=Pseudooceanicola albus TaxID=2692189 RepID=A0A6L7G1S0_9RHOB|nr:MULTISPECIES: C69 family dipeptidase [Pseudooceanicola]MBT9383511.1 C69 family dipeptidase [Pseudooceanicola endophyticus]MXN17367.1 hypothetical protein [Pseudooceanicola albus]
MCDTLLVLGPLSADGRSYFAKNSDREPNEAQYLTRVPAASHAPGTRLRTTYAELPQAERTHACLGSRPWWIWGFEHGVNEHGLTIGNEAVWSRLPADPEPGLLGMDLLRLTLERARDADEGLAVLTGLLERYGQAGRAAVTRDMFYHNAFLLADGRRGWVIETAGRHWAARRVTGWATISNVYQIGSDYDLISNGAEAFAVAQGWHDPARPFDWAAAFTDPDRPNLKSCRARLAMSQAHLAGRVAIPPEGGIGRDAMIAALRDHGPGAEDRAPGLEGQSCVCMHAVQADTGSETAASMVVALSPGDTPPEIWGSLGSPCLSGFLPLWVDCDPPAPWQQPETGADPDAWWQIEGMQRRIEPHFPDEAPALRARLDALTREAAVLCAALPADAPAARRAALGAMLAERQAGIVAAARARADQLPPRPDPRGSYLPQVEAARPRTTAEARRALAAQRPARPL